MEKPEQQVVINYDEIQILTDVYLDDIGTERMTEGQQAYREYLVFQAVMNAIYGDSVWEYINSKI